MEAYLDELLGPIDGTNVWFQTPLRYQAGSVVVYVNGISHDAANDDGWIETSPTSGALTLKEPPVAGDVLFAFYLGPDAPVPPEAELALLDNQAELALLEALAMLTEPVLAELALADSEPVDVDVVAVTELQIDAPTADLEVAGAAEVTLELVVP